MKIILAPDSYKGNLSSIEVAKAMEKGIKKVDNKIIVKKIPVADGGEGTVEAFLMAAGGKQIDLEVHGPLMDRTKSFFGILPDNKTAVIEMAAASGLNKIPLNSRNPMKTSTYGVGELIRSAMLYGCKKIILGIGGSSTNDGGVGMAQSLGAKFFDKDNNILAQGGKVLNKINKIDISGIDKRLKKVKIVAACDVKNLMYGKNGAAYVYGKQKGANSKMIEELDKGMINYCNVLKKQLNINISHIKGSGAAGGLGGGILAFTNSKLKSGIDIVIEYSGIIKELNNTDLLITGEGKTDKQTAYGKVPAGLGKIAKKYNVPVVCISGSLSYGYKEVFDCGVDGIFSITDKPMSIANSYKRSQQLIENETYSIVNLVKKVIYTKRNKT